MEAQRSQARDEMSHQPLDEKSMETTISRRGGRGGTDTNFREADPEKVHEIQQHGVSRIEAFSRLFSRRHPVAITLYFCILAVAVSFSLDQSTTAAYDVYATAAFDRQSYIGTIEIAEAIIVAVSKPFIAKICDVFSRQTAYIIILVSYVVGYIIVASANTAAALCVGRVISSTGQSGFDLITDIVVGDLSPLQWRGFTSALTSFPYLFLPFVGSKIQASLCTGNTNHCWRWGYGMFCIIAPVLVSPIIVTLVYADRQAEKAGELSFAASRLETKRAIEAGTMQAQRGSVRERFVTFCRLLDEIDLIGLLLLAMAFALILLPFSLASDADGGWSNASMIAMFVCGFVILILFIVWDVRWAHFPLLNKRVWHNKTFICAVIIDIFYMVSGNVRSTYYTTWVYVIKPWSNYNWGNFVAITTVSLTFFGLLAGIYQRIFHRYKVLQIFGLSLRILALGITYWAVGPNASTAALVMASLLGGMGGACSVVGTRVASQASVPHQDLASIISQLSLWTKLGSSVGSAISSTMYTNTYMNNLLEEGLSSEDALVFYSSSTKARVKFPWGTEKREAGIRAFTNTVRPIFLTALCLSVIPLIFGLIMPNYYLGKTQNVVDGTTNGGVVVNEYVNEGQRDRDTGDGINGDKSWVRKLWKGVRN
ncbi:putative siderophore iron [Phaeomoniella chlamydospora]|uniref:Putative siderophore iron n=1 Tax=Phaeomoniella chlamydospora TaxID=158046 RepID=A0A0G2E0Q7_PHACM|nr:putative siderophore iron [Phaeomoniella chlamydospora]